MKPSRRFLLAATLFASIAGGCSSEPDGAEGDAQAVTGGPAGARGACVVRDDVSSLPKITDPDVGSGFAKVEVLGAHDLGSLQTACTDAIFSDLVAKHCATGKTSVHREVVVFDSSGAHVASQGASQGDDLVACPSSGSCVVRDVASSLPNATAPDVGSGYAKVAIAGVNDLAALQHACTDKVYADLVAKHCAISRTPVQREVVTYDASGAPASSQGAAQGDEPVACPSSGACVVRDASTTIPRATDPDVGPGYAKVEISGVSDLDTLQSFCTDAIYTQLLAQHCAVSATPVQREVVTFDASGTHASSRGAAQGDAPISCP